MARIVVAFLGISARRTQYRWSEELVYPGEVFPEALLDYLDEHRGGFDQALLLVTEDARRKTWPLLQARNDARLRAVDIPEGHTPAEMWAWFEALLPYVAQGDTLIFDITHGLRSAPFLIFLFTAYLRQVREVHIEGVYYGAYELGRGGPAPVMDLSPFVRLLDWLIASAFFQRNGDARLLAQVLRDIAQQHRLGELKTAAQNLEELSLALMLTRPLEVMEKAHRWAQDLAALEQRPEPALRPFHELAVQLRHAYAAHALLSPKEHPWPALERQFRLIEWYVENRQVLQAATLAVEWVISVVAWLMEGRLVLRLRRRESWAQAVHQVVRHATGRMPEEALSEQALQLRAAHPALVALLQPMWEALSTLRNDLNHAGMRENASRASRLRQRMQHLMPHLRALFTYAARAQAAPGASSSEADA